MRDHLRLDRRRPPPRRLAILASSAFRIGPTHTTMISMLGISSMATRQLMGELAEASRDGGSASVRFESVGGVDAAARVRAGEPFDLIVLAEEAMGALDAAGCLIAGSLRPIAESRVAIAGRADAVQPDVSTADALRDAVLAAGRIGYSTGPSGTALIQLFTRLGLLDVLRERLVQAQPGSPVAALLSSGRADIGFQQFSELKDESGVTVLGPMPPGLEIVTTFVGAVGARSACVAEARAMLEFMASPAADDIRIRHGMARPATNAANSPTPPTEKHP